jgi:hypothetical protein
MREILSEYFNYYKLQSPLVLRAISGSTAMRGLLMLLLKLLNAQKRYTPALR